MRVSVITPDLSHNCVGRAYVLARLLERNHDVEIVGLQFEEEVWPPLKDAYEYAGIRADTRLPNSLVAISELSDTVTGDVIYASKPMLSSYGTALLAAIGRDRPVILDIDDWQSGFHYQAGKVVTYLNGLTQLGNIDSFYYTRLCEFLSGVANARTVSNRFLKERFGGTIIPHVKDTIKLDPDTIEKVNARKELKLPTDEFLVMFSGTPRPYKGVDDLVQAVASIQDRKIRSVVVGANESPYVDKLKRIGGQSLIVHGVQPYASLPKWIAAADVIAIPQKATPATRGQLPSKVFDAMAMAKPIISTDVNDLPIVLKDCGRIVTPGNVEELRHQIVKLMDEPQLREQLGQNARERCVNNYSIKSLSPVMDSLIQSVS